MVWRPRVSEGEREFWKRDTLGILKATVIEEVLKMFIVC